MAMRFLRMGAVLCAALAFGLSGAASLAEEGSSMRISVSDGTSEVAFELEDTTAARSLYAMLPFTVKVENYSSNEKIFHPPEKIATGSDEVEKACPAGTLALFSPWGNVVMFYGPADKYPGLYVLGRAVSSSERISRMTGSVTVSRAD